MQQCWKLPEGGGEARPVNPHDRFEPTESADGRLLYFTRQNALWTMDLKTWKESPVREQDGKLVAQQWPLTSGAIFYAPPEEGSGMPHYRLDLRTRQTNRISSLRGPFPFNQTVPLFDISPDEERFLTYDVEYRVGDISLLENLHLK